MKQRRHDNLSSIYWIVALLLLISFPLLVLIVSTPPWMTGQGVSWDFSMALGFSVMGLMLTMFVLTARIRHLTAPFGIDLVYYFHRQVAIGLVLLAITHVGVLLYSEPVLANNNYLTAMPLNMLAGYIAIMMLFLLVALSLLRRRFKFRYDVWRQTHLLFAMVAILAAVIHIAGVNHYSSTLWMAGLAVIALFIWTVLILRVRLFKPWSLVRHPWHVVSVKPERGRAVTLKLEPQQQPGLCFAAGQFAWLTINQSPFSMAEHPFSIASSAENNGTISFTIKALGDFTSRIQKIKPGATAYVDGPYGVFSMDNVEADSLFFVAGGIGIVPVMSMLRTLADRDDKRTLTLVYSVSDLENMTYYEDLRSLENLLPLTLVPVPNRATTEWHGARGCIDQPLLQRYLHDNAKDCHYFLCGPPAMMEAVESALHECGVYYRQIHSELFNLV